MSRLDAWDSRGAAGRPLVLKVAGPAGVVTAQVSPLRGEDELRARSFFDRRADLPSVLRESVLLELAVTGLNGAPPTAQALDGLALGDRSRLVLATLCASYGAPEELLMQCREASCGAWISLPFDPAPILDAAPARIAPLRFETGGASFAVRAPTGTDMITLADRGANSVAQLLEICAPGVPAAALPQVEALWASGDACAELIYAADCPSCGAGLGTRLDPLLLVELAMQAEGGVAAEFDLLARSYGWSDAILSQMPAWRRRVYIQTIRAAEDARADAPLPRRMQA